MSWDPNHRHLPARMLRLSLQPSSPIMSWTTLAQGAVQRPPAFALLMMEVLPRESPSHPRSGGEVGERVCASRGRGRQLNTACDALPPIPSPPLANARRGGERRDPIQAVTIFARRYQSAIACAALAMMSGGIA